MIRSFRHRGLRRLYERGDPRGIPAHLVTRVQNALTILGIARHPRALVLPGLRLHQLQGRLKGRWAVSVCGNWRIVFRFAGEDAVEVDLVDYH